MQQIIEFLALYIVLPAVFLAILLFDVILIRRSQNVEARLQALAGAIAGLLISVIVVLLDLNFQGRILPPSYGSSFEEVWPTAVIAGIIGFSILVLVDFLTARRVVHFIVMLTVSGVLVSIYYLLSVSVVKLSTSVSVLGFVVGVIIYFMLFPTKIYSHLYADRKKVSR